MSEPINIGKRRELFWDDTIIDTKRTKAYFKTHSLKKENCILTFDEDYGGDGCQYSSVLFDGEKYRMYITVHNSPKCRNFKKMRAFLCYAESRDGINWEKPVVGQHEYEGSKENCILFREDKFPNYRGIDGFRPFVDTNPDCKENERIKALGDFDGKLWVFTSPDGIDFTAKCTIDVPGQFDSVNTLLYDKYRKKYRCFFRAYHPHSHPNEHQWIRDIRITESDNLESWTEPEIIHYSDYMNWQLYTNGISMYDRADHVYVGFPTRYVTRADDYWVPNFEEMKGSELRHDICFDGKVDKRCATAQTDSLFMTSRDGLFWTRYNDALLTAGPEDGKNWYYGSAYLTNGLIETKSQYKGCDNELSFFAAENRWTGEPGKIYRYTMRLDGFVSLRADWDASWDEKSIVTKPFIYDGNDLFINFSTSAYGGVKIELQSQTSGKKIVSGEMFGNATDRRVIWDGAGPESLKGETVEMYIHMHDADMYSFKFE